MLLASSLAGCKIIRRAVSAARHQHLPRSALSPSRITSAFCAFPEAILCSIMPSVSPNPSIERTSSSQLRWPAAAAHVER